MAQQEQIRTSRLTRPGDIVKAKLIALGLRQRDLANEAGLSPTRLSELISGRRRNRSEQYAVFQAARRLTGERFELGYLWRELQEAGE